MPHNPVKSSRGLFFGGILLFGIVGFAAISTTIAKISLSGVILVLVAFAEAGLIIFGLFTVQRGRDASVANQENAYSNVPP
jgi:hypothetical protein